MRCASVLTAGPISLGEEGWGEGRRATSEVGKRKDAHSRRRPSDVPALTLDVPPAAAEIHTKPLTRRTGEHER